MKVSFDFDGTLDREAVQKYASELISRGVEVWICTSRFKDNNEFRKNWNDDLFKIADELGIIRERIIFTEFEFKANVLKDTDFIWHLDDDWIECKRLASKTKIKGISAFGNSSWKHKCERLLK